MSARAVSAGSCSGQEPVQERILVVCTRYIGDTVLAIPFLRNLRRAFPAARIDVCAEGAAREVLADCPYVDELIAWQRPAGRRGLFRNLAALGRQAAWLTGRKYTRAYLLKRSLSAAALAWWAGIPRRIGLAGDGRWLSTRVVTPTPGRHQAARYLDLLRADGLSLDDGRCENWSSPAARARAATLLERLPVGRQRVFLAPCSTAPERLWPVGRWAALVEWLVLERRAEVVLCGGSDDLAVHNELRCSLDAEVAAHLHDFTDLLSLREAGSVVAAMDGCVGVDTGLVHLAASHGVPVTVLFGPTDPHQWSPWTARAAVVRSARVQPERTVRRRSAAASLPAAWPRGVASMEDIAVEDVVVAVAKLLPEVPQPTVAKPPPALKTLDLRAGSFRYELVRVAAGSSAARAAAEPATKPLAQAH
jgi:heptosyltransferase-2